MGLSKRSQDFLDDLRLYLFSSGKDDREIAEVISELEDHLIESEQNGKDVEYLVGQSPKAYMEQIAGELDVDLKGWLKYIPILLVGAYAYMLLGNAIRGGVEYSLWRAIGDVIVFVITLLLYSSTFKYMASHTLSVVKERMLFLMLGMVPIGLFVGLMLLDRVIDSPAIVFNLVGNAITIGVCVAVFIVISIWSKTWVSIIVPAILFLPEVLLGLTSLRLETQMIWSTITMFGGLFIYYLVTIKFEKVR
ncbi:HAAS domain-containing protein [Halobacillus sp. MO56]